MSDAGDKYGGRDTTGRLFYYRLVTATLEYREMRSLQWSPVTGKMMLRLTPDQLRAVANAIDRKDG